MRQVEICRTLVFDGDCHAHAFSEVLLCGKMDLAARKTSGCCSSAARGERRGQPVIPPAVRIAIDWYCHYHQRRERAVRPIFISSRTMYINIRLLHVA